MIEAIEKKKTSTGPLSPVTDEGLHWPVSNKTLEALTLAELPLLVTFYQFLMNELINSTKNIKEVEEFIITFLPALYGYFHGASIGPVTYAGLRIKLTEFLDDPYFNKFLAKRDQLAPYLVYSLLAGKVVKKLSPELLATIVTIVSKAETASFLV